MEATTSQSQNSVTSADLMNLQNSDNSGMVLVTAPLTRNNYRSQNRAVKIALRAKQKFGMIDGTIKLSEKDSTEYEGWRKCDFMVTSQILNLISKELTDASIYTNLAKDLWDEIAERYEKATNLSFTRSKGKSTRCSKVMILYLYILQN